MDVSAAGKDPAGPSTSRRDEALLPESEPVGQPGAEGAVAGLAGESATPPAVLRAGLAGVRSLLQWMGPGRYIIADATGAACYMLMRAHRRRSVANFQRALGVTRSRAKELSRASFQEYARTSLDFIWALGLSRDAVLAMSHVAGIEPVLDDVREGKGGILALTHYGTWDMAANVAQAHGIALTTVMATLGPVNDLVVWARAGNGLELYTPHHAARGLFRAIGMGRFVALLCDIPSAGHTVPVDYCGGRVLFSSAPAWLARSTGRRVFPVCSRRKNGAFEIIVFPPLEPGAGETDQQLMQRVATAIEVEVLAEPEQWYPFHHVFAD